MHSILDCVRGLPLFAAVATAAANYPAIPSDKTTPVQQRLAISGANCELLFVWRHLLPKGVQESEVRLTWDSFEQLFQLGGTRLSSWPRLACSMGPAVAISIYSSAQTYL